MGPHVGGYEEAGPTSKIFSLGVTWRDVIGGELDASHIETWSPDISLFYLNRGNSVGSF